MPDIEALHKGLEQRKRWETAAWIALSLMACLFLWGASGDDTASPAAGSTPPLETPSTFLSLTDKILDTVYTPSSAIIEVRLDSQLLILRRRGMPDIAYPVSSGNPALRKGMETREGIFLVQNKIEWLYSLQFDSTKVFNWLGFNWGIGFHSLAGRGYHRHLGVRPSSHGCVRLSDEHARALYNSVTIGTPVFVHKGNAARVVAFSADTSFPAGELTQREAETLHAQRLADLYDGTYLFRAHPVLMLTRQQIGHNGIPAGSASLAPERQSIPPSYNSHPRAPRVSTKTEESVPPRWKQSPVDNGMDRMERSILP